MIHHGEIHFEIYLLQAWRGGGVFCLTRFKERYFEGWCKKKERNTELWPSLFTLRLC